MKYAAFIFFISLVLFTTQTVQSQVNKDKYALLWKIEGKDLPAPSYLFGTMHVKNKKAFEFPDELITYFKSSKNIAFELNLDSVLKNSAQEAVSRLEKSILFEEVEVNVSADKIKENGLDIDLFTGKNILQLEELMNNLVFKEEPKMPIFLDAFLFQKGKTLSKELYGLEKFEDQISLLADYKNQMVEDFIQNKVNEFKKYKSNSKKLMNMYHAGDLEAIEELVMDSDAYFKQKVLIDRNFGMVEQMIPLMQSGSTFTAVGTAHLPGKDGILDLLRKKGYKVSKVAVNFENKAGHDNFLKFENDLDWLTSVDSIDGYSVQVPFAPVPIDAFSEQLRMKIAQDMSNNDFYAIYCMEVSDYNSSSPMETLKNVLNGVSSKQQITTSIVKKIEYMGLEGLSSHVINKSFEGNIRLFIKNARVYMFFYASMDYAPNDREKKFFESVQIQDLEVQNHATTWSNFQNKQGAFAIDFLGDPIYNTNIIPGEMEGQDWLLHSLSFLSIKNDQSFFIKWNDLAKGTEYDFKSDSIMAIENLKVVLENSPNALDQGAVKEQFENYVQFTTRPFQSLDGYVVQARCIIRGTRIYVLWAASNQQAKVSNIDHFINSFTTKPFDSATYTRTSYKEIELSIPSDFLIVEKIDTANLVELGQSNEILGSVDTANGSTIILEVIHYSDLFRYASTQSILDNLSYIPAPGSGVEKMTATDASLFAENEDNVAEDGFSEGDFSEDGFSEGDFSEYGLLDESYMAPYNGKMELDTVFYQTDSTFWIRGKYRRAPGNWVTYSDIILSNQHLYEVTIQGSEEQLLDVRNKMDLRLIPASSENNLQLFSSKTAPIIQKLQSADTIQYTEGLKALEYSSFDLEELDALQEIMAMPLPTTMEIGLTNRTDIEVAKRLKTFEDQKSYSMLVDHYQKVADTEAGELLLEYVMDHPATNAETFIDIYLSTPPLLESFYYNNQLLQNVLKKPDLFHEKFQSIVDLSKKDLYYRGSFLNSISTNFDSISFNSIEKEQITKFAIESLQLIGQNTTKKGVFDIQHNYIFTNIIQLSYHLLSPALDSEIFKSEPGSNVESIYEKALHLQSNNKKVPKEYHQLMLASPYYGFKYIYQMNELGLISKVPKETLKKDKLTHLALNYFLYLYDIEASNLQPIEKHSANGNSYQLFTFTYEGEELKYMLIMSEVERKNNHINFDNIYFNYTFDVISTPEEYKQAINNLIQIDPFIEVVCSDDIKNY